MKQSISPVVAVIVVVIVLAVVGLFYWRANNVAGAREGDKSYQMPAEAAKSLSEVMGNRGGQTAPPMGNNDPARATTAPGSTGGGIPAGPMTGPGAR